MFMISLAWIASIAGVTALYIFIFMMFDAMYVFSAYSSI